MKNPHLPKITITTTSVLIATAAIITTACGYSSSRPEVDMDRTGTSIRMGAGLSRGAYGTRTVEGVQGGPQTTSDAVTTPDTISERKGIMAVDTLGRHVENY